MGGVLDRASILIDDLTRFHHATGEVDVLGNLLTLFLRGIYLPPRALIDKDLLSSVQVNNAGRGAPSLSLVPETKAVQKICDFRIIIR